MLENGTDSGRRAIYSESELLALMERGEGQFLEFKSAWDRSAGTPRPLSRRALRDKIAEVVAGFANADGGTLLVGVEDDGTPSGHGYPEAVVEGLFATPKQRLRDQVSCETDRIKVGDSEVLVFRVLMAPAAVMVEGNGFPYRVGAATIREPQNVINDRKQAYRRVGYEARFRQEAGLDVLDQEVAREFFERTPVGRRPLADALRHYRLIEASAAGWRLTNAALLLFGRRSDFRWHHRAGIRFFRVAGTDRKHGRHRNVTQIANIAPPIARALDEALLVGRGQVGRREVLNGAIFEDETEYPEFAWKEAIVNAVAHRDYEVAGREIEVWFYDDRLEVTSPGGLVAPATEEALRSGESAHASRNPLLVQALAAAAYMRDEGEGIPRMFDEMREHRLPPPQIAIKHGIFTLTLRNGRNPEKRP